MHLFELDVIASLVVQDVDLQVAIVSLGVVDVFIKKMVDVNDSCLNLLGLIHNSFTKGLDVLQSTSRALKDCLRDEVVSIAHKLLIFTDLLVKEIREDVTSNDLVLFSADWRDRGFSLSC